LPAVLVILDVVADGPTAVASTVLAVADLIGALGDNRDDAAGTQQGAIPT